MCLGSSRSLDRFATTVDHEGLVANAGLILAGTLMARLGVSALIERWVRTGSANPGPKICTVVAAMLAGGTHIDHVGMLRAGRTGRVLGFRPMAPSTVGTLRRTFTFGHVRQLEAVLSRTLARAWGLGAGPGDKPLVVDPDSTICEVHGKQKQGAAYGLHQRARLSPAARCTRRHRRGARRPHAQRLRRVVARRGALRRRARREPATRRGRRADHGARRLSFWSRKLIDRLDAHNIKWSITVALRSAVRAAIQAIGDDAWTDIAYTKGGHAQVAETTYATGRGKAKRTVRLVVRRTRLTEGAQQRLWPDWRHHAFNANTEHPPPPRTSSTAPTPSSSSPSATSKKAPDSNTSPQGTTARTAHRSPAPVLAHNISHWTTALAGAPPATNRSRRTRLVALAAVRGQPLRHTHPAIPRPLALGNTIHSHTQRSQGSARTLRLTEPPGTGAPTQTQRRQPQTTPAPLAEHAQTHQTTPPTTRRDPNPPPTREPHAHQRPIGGFRLRSRHGTGACSSCVDQLR